MRLLLALPVFAVIAVLAIYLPGGRYVTTDDAYLQADLIPIAANVSGPVVGVDVDENQHVAAGDVLFRIDPALFALSVEEASAQLAEARAVAGAANDGRTAQPPSVRRAQAALDRAELLLSFTSVRAPQDGIVTKVTQLHAGSYVSASRTVFTLVTRRVWVEANFKETQIGHMRIGQPVRFKVDAYPDLELHGSLMSFSPGAANSFAVLPAENATGNWVKVVQRVPVQLAVDNWPENIPLRTGLSVVVTVDTGEVQSVTGRPAAMIAAYPDPGTRRLITLSVLAATFMQALDTTIANVALPHMQGSVSASADEIIWVLTSYIVAAAIFTPLSGWLAGRFGRPQIILVGIAGFTVASGLCGTATSIQELVAYRLLQGMFGAALQPLSQAILLDINPPERHGSAIAVWGIGAMLAPIVGPTLGGWLTENFTWRWVFFINLPIGVLAYLGIAAFLKEKRTTKPVHFNFLGFTLLALALAFVQLVLDRGQGRDWFDSKEICVEAGAGLIFAYLFVVHTMTAGRPFINRELFTDRNFVVATVTAFFVNMILFSVLALLPAMLSRLMHYPVVLIGIVTAPRGVGTLVSMLAAGQLVKRIDPRWVLFAGFVLIGIAQFQMSGFSSGMDASLVLYSGFIQGCGAGLVLVPLTAMSFETLRSELRNEGAAMYTLIRAMGSAFGVAVLQAITIRNMSAVRAQLVEQVRPDNPVVGRAYPDLDFGASADLAGLNGAVTQQAAMVAYVDAFHMLFLIAIAAMPLLLLLRGRRREPLGHSRPA